MSQPHWVDYANLGVNIGNLAVNSAQLQSLYEVNSQLAQLAQIEANRERRRQLENNLRQFVFDEETKLEELKAQFGANPASLWVGAHLIEHNLESVPITAASFQEFVDKDRVRKFGGEILAIIRECETQLSPSQLNNVRLALQYISERAALDQYIEMQRETEFLATTDQEFRKTDKDVGTRTKKWMLGCLGTVIIPILVFAVGYWIIDNLLHNLWSSMTPEQRNRFGDYVKVLLFGVPVVLLLAGGVWLWIKNKQFMPIYGRLKELRSQREIAMANLPSPERQNQLVKLFGQGLTSQQLTMMKDDRERQIRVLLRWP